MSSAGVAMTVRSIAAAWPREEQWSDLTVGLWLAEFADIDDSILGAATVVAVRTLDRSPTVHQFRELVASEIRRGQVTPALPPAPSDPDERERCRQIIAGIRANLAGLARSKR